MMSGPAPWGPRTETLPGGSPLGARALCAGRTQEDAQNCGSLEEMSENSWGGSDDCHVPSLGPWGPYLGLHHDAFMTFIALTMYMNASFTGDELPCSKAHVSFFFFFPLVLFTFLSAKERCLNV